MTTDPGMPIPSCRKKPFYSAAAIGIIALVVVGGTLYFANPQMNRWLYVLQKYYFQKKGMLPDQFSGVWRTWHKNGLMQTEVNYSRGLLDGHFSYWSSTGELMMESNYAHGRSNGITVTYGPNKIPVRTGLMVNGDLVGKWTEWGFAGNISSNRWFIKSKEVNETEYRAAAEKDPTLPRPWEQEGAKGMSVRVAPEETK